MCFAAARGCDPEGNRRARPQGYGTRGEERGAVVFEPWTWWNIPVDDLANKIFHRFNEAKKADEAPKPKGKGK